MQGVSVSEALSIGRLAAVTGLPVTTIRFRSDAGLPPSRAFAPGAPA